MKNGYLALIGFGLLSSSSQAQDAAYIPEATQNVGYSGAYLGAGSVGSSEPLFKYSDQERWKHGYIQNMPYYEGYHSFRPYNYHHVYSQSQTAAGWGMPATMPYSQQFWHRYEKMTDLSRGDHSPIAPYVPPPDEWDHYPKPLRQGTFMTPQPTPNRIPAVEETADQLRSVSPVSLQQFPSEFSQTQPTAWTGTTSVPTAPLLAPY